MEIWQLILLTAIGCASGFINVMAGGGSLLVLPVMILMGLEGPVANGTIRLGILTQNITAVGKFAHKGYSNFKLSASLAACALPGAVLGAYLGTKLSGVWFNRTLAAIMVAVLVLMSLKGKKSKEEAPESDPAAAPTARRIFFAHVLMLLAGFYGGFIQAGVGFLLMAILHKVLGLDLVRTNMHKVFIVGVYTIFALAIFAVRGRVIWLPAIALAIGNSAGAWVGTHFAITKGRRLIKIIFNIAIIAMAIKLLLY